MAGDKAAGFRRDVILGLLILGLGGALVWQVVSGGDVDPTATGLLGSAMTMLVQGHSGNKEDQK